jgi:RNA polymerase sigma-70 factor (ECF subfamily)
MKITAWLPRPLHHRAVRDFRSAAVSGDAARLESMLAPDVAVVVDGGDDEQPALRMVTGTFDAVALLLHGLGRKPGLDVVERQVNGQSGLLLIADGEPTAAMTIDFAGALVSVVWIRLHPLALRHGLTV